MDKKRCLVVGLKFNPHMHAYMQNEKSSLWQEVLHLPVENTVGDVYHGGFTFG